MDSINRNQPEHNHEDLYAAEAAEKIRELVLSAETCFFCTTPLPGGSHGTRPMSVREVDAEGNLWFLSAGDSHKNRELLSDPSVKLYFQGSAHSDFLVLTGRAEVSDDRERIRELWNPLIRTWFTEGVEDPRITVIRVVPEEGYYWDTKHGNAVAGIKMLLGAITGTTLDDSIEGSLTLH